MCDTGKERAFVFGILADRNDVSVKLVLFEQLEDALGLLLQNIDSFFSQNFDYQRIDGRGRFQASIKFVAKRGRAIYFS